MSENPSESLQKIIDSFQHPFYVIDIDNYIIKFANKACNFGALDGKMTCHMLTHKLPAPCAEQHVCPLAEIKRTKQPVLTEHIHYDAQGNPRDMEVHGDPVFDEKGNLVMMIKYAFDITERKKAEKELEQKMQEIEKLNKFMMGREVRIIELKKEIDTLLKDAGKVSKYKV